MKLTITGSLGNISRPLAKRLLAEGHQLTIVSGTAARAGDIEAMGAKAVIGDLYDAGTYIRAFEGADAVYAMTPPNLGGGNVVENTARAGAAMADAIRHTGVKRVVMLSSIGADLPAGTGPIAGLYRIEQLYRDLPGVQVLFLRAGFFYINFYHDIPVIKAAGIMGNNFSGGTVMPMVHPEDIAEAVAKGLVSGNNGVEYVISDIRTASEVAAVLGAAIGRPGLPWVQFSDEQLLQGMTQAGIPSDIAAMYAEMGRGMGDGSIARHFQSEGSVVNGRTRLETFAKVFAEKFSG